MSWKDYKGIAGYNQMIDEIRSSIYKDFPEAKGKIYIFNHLANQDEEVKRAEKELGIPDLKKDANLVLQAMKRNSNFPDISGMMLPIEYENGKRVFLAMGWNPKSNYVEAHGKKIKIADTLDKKLEKELTPEYIRTLAWNNLHEAGHALQWLTRLYNYNGAIGVNKENVGIYPESGAEVFARSLLVHNGVKKEGFVYEVMADYDARKYSGIDYYDPSRALLYVTGFDPTKENELKSYNLKGVKDAFYLSHGVTKNFLGNSAEQYSEFTQNQALAVAASYLAQDKGFSEEQIKNWIKERNDIVLRAGQIEAGDNYLKNPVGEYKGFEKPDIKLEQVASRAWLKYQQTHDKADGIMASVLISGMLDLNKHGLKHSTELDKNNAQVLLQNKDWENIAKRMAAGESIEYTAPDIKKFIDEHKISVPSQIPNKVNTNLIR